MAPSRPDLTGGWCWFQEPRVVTTPTATFVGWTEYDDQGTVGVARFDHDDMTFEVNREVGATPDLAPDDHNSPAIYVRRDGRIVVYYTAHNRPDGNRYRVSAEPDSIDSFGEERSIPDHNQSTYPMPFRLAEPEEQFYFYRDGPDDGSPSTFYFYRSSDDGETWSERERLFQIEGDDYSGYIKVAASDERLDICYSRHPRPAPLGKCDVRHFYYDGADDQFKDSHGTPIETPIREEEMTKLFDAEDRGERGWIWDVMTDGEEPAIVFSSFTDGDEADQRYYYAKFADSSWTVSEVVETDHVYATNTDTAVNEQEYAPGISLGHLQGDDVLYLSRGPKSREDKQQGLDVERWRVGDDFETFERDRVVERGTESNQFRPVAPRSVGTEEHDSPVRTVWMSGQSRAPYNYHDNEETLQLKAEIETASGLETVRMDEWESYEG
ncbi:BNR-4 repeat-containing protein [Halosimplex sp. TS25]|uniref:BNR-4 repeat-containing protein n=1 Tax=Halosimplex rarum TaxID=3396619 RepID=UPI0039EC1759